MGVPFPVSEALHHLRLMANVDKHDVVCQATLDGGMNPPLRHGSGWGPVVFGNNSASHGAH